MPRWRRAVADEADGLFGQSSGTWINAGASATMGIRIKQPEEDDKSDGVTRNNSSKFMS